MMELTGFTELTRFAELTGLTDLTHFTELTSFRVDRDDIVCMVHQVDSFDQV